MENKIKFGWAEVDITPKEKIKLAGQFYERISDEVETPLTVTALAIECGNEQTVLCSCDLVSVSEGLISRVREHLAGTEGLDLDKIIIGATHTHTAYVYDRRDSNGKEKKHESSSSLDVIKRFIPEGKKYIPLVSGEAMDPFDALLFLAEKIAEAVKKAWEARDYGCYASGFGRAAVGMCRRVCYSDGSAKMWGDVDKATFTQMEGGNDSGVELLYIFDANKKLTGVLANVACPAQVVEQRSFISSDYWGKLKILLREKWGKDLFVFGLASPAGDQCPRDLVRWVEPETPIADPNVPQRKFSRRADPSMYDVAGTWRIAKRLANEIFDAYEIFGEDIVETAEFEHRVETLELPLRRATIAEYNDAVKNLTEFFRYCEGDINYMESAQLHVYGGTVVRFESRSSQTPSPWSCTPCASATWHSLPIPSSCSSITATRSVQEAMQSRPSCSS